VHDLLAALRSSRAVKVFVCNIATQAGETEAYTCRDHVRAMEEHIGVDAFDVIVCNDNYEITLGSQSQWVRADEESLADPRLYCADLVDRNHPWRHDSPKLAQTLINIMYERTGPLK
jgi:uncharacterized cofD-like protein